MERVILCEINFRRKIGRVGKVFFAFEVAKIVAQVQLHISSFCKYATRGRVSKQKKSEEEGEEEEEEGWLCFESQQGPSSP